MHRSIHTKFAGRRQYCNDTSERVDVTHRRRSLRNARCTQTINKQQQKIERAIVCNASHSGRLVDLELRRRRQQRRCPMTMMSAAYARAAYQRRQSTRVGAIGLLCGRCNDRSLARARVRSFPFVTATLHGASRCAPRARALIDGAAAANNLSARARAGGWRSPIGASSSLIP